MDRDRLAQALLETFLDELESHVAALNRELLALEAAASDAARQPLFQSLLRTIHTVKGSSRAASIHPVERLCHRLEELVTRWSSRASAPPADEVERLFAAADALDEAGALLRSGRGKAPDLEVALSRLRVEGDAPPLSPVAEAIPQRPRSEALPVRVSPQKLDALLARCGELRVSTLRLDARVTALEAMTDELGKGAAALPRLRTELTLLTRALVRDRQTLNLSSRAIEDEVRRARMLPFSEVCTGLERAVRDVAKAAGKEAHLDIVGTALELDRSMLSALREPLLHLVRNAVSHGIEAPRERERRGKPREGRITLSARLTGGLIEVKVSDDGAGLDLEAIRTQALRKNLVRGDSDEDVAHLIFRPGFSTASFVTDVSGRGVGLDAVRSRVEALRGDIDVASTPGRGAEFILRLPLTLSTLRALLVAAGDQLFAVPSQNVLRLLRTTPHDVQQVQGRQSVRSDGRWLPLADLQALLGLPFSPTRRSTVPTLLVETTDGRPAALTVDAVVEEQEVLVKSLGARLKRARYCSELAVLPDGRSCLLLQPSELARAICGQLSTAAPLFAAPQEAVRPRRVLLVDDAPTTRALEQSILESAGYQVMACVDGQEAWETLLREGADALVADVEMPRMDGFALTEAVRGTPRFARLPVVLVTGREREEDKRRGLEVGASAYLVKSAFDQQNLLTTLSQLL